MRNSLTYGLFRTPVRNWMYDFDNFFDRAVPDVNRESSTIPFTIDETESGYLLTADLPGVGKEDLKLEIAGQVLTLSGERKHHGSDALKFSYRLLVPSDADGSKTEANLENGVLHVAIPKSEAAQARTIQIHSGETGGLFSRLLGNKKTGTDTN